MSRRRGTSDNANERTVDSCRVASNVELHERTKSAVGQSAGDVSETEAATPGDVTPFTMKCPRPPHFGFSVHCAFHK